jgi:hypothetical protein
MPWREVCSSKIVCCFEALLVCLLVSRLDPRPDSPLPTSNIGFQVDALGAKRIAEEVTNASR